MGMFTSVYVPYIGAGEVEVQFKCGEDMCEKYRVGDMVEWRVDKDYYMQGKLLDDIYDGFSLDEELDLSGGKIKTKNVGRHWWVVISDHKIVEVVLKIFQGNDDSEYNSDYNYKQYLELKEKWNVKKWDENWWTKEAKEKYLKLEAEYEKEREEWENKVGYVDKTPEEKFLLNTMRLVSRRVNYVELAKKMVQVEPLPEGQVYIYDKEEK